MKIYVAGPLGPKGLRVAGVGVASLAIEYLLNARDLIRTAAELVMRGHYPFCPALDMLYFLVLKPGEEISETTIKENSLIWLEDCDAILMTGRWEDSLGCQAELQRAIELGMPIFYGIEEIPREGYNER